MTYPQSIYRLTCRNLSASLVGYVSARCGASLRDRIYVLPCTQLFWSRWPSVGPMPPIRLGDDTAMSIDTIAHVYPLLRYYRSCPSSGATLSILVQQQFGFDKALVKLLEPRRLFL